MLLACSSVLRVWNSLCAGGPRQSAPQHRTRRLAAVLGTAVCVRVCSLLQTVRAWGACLWLE